MVGEPSAHGGVRRETRSDGLCRDLLCQKRVAVRVALMPTTRGRALHIASTISYCRRWALGVVSRLDSPLVMWGSHRVGATARNPPSLRRQTAQPSSLLRPCLWVGIGPSASHSRPRAYKRREITLPVRWFGQGSEPASA